MNDLQMERLIAAVTARQDAEGCTCEFEASVLEVRPGVCKVEIRHMDECPIHLRQAASTN